MAGRGPRPKDPSKRARRNAEQGPTTILRFERAKQPPLGRLPGGGAWGKPTLDWWATWGKSPQAEHFSSTDWDYLRDTALLHRAVWVDQNLRALPELRLRVAKFGATLEDRARLRMQFAEADEADAKRPEGRSSRERYGALVALPSSASQGATIASGGKSV